LTAYFLVRPNITTWRAAAEELTRTCGGSVVCDRKRIHRDGWTRNAPGPHDWSTRTTTKKKLSWAAMGAGFSDQGFVEYFFALKRKTALLVSKRSCPRRLHYLHFNVPPKPWTCPDAKECHRPPDKKHWDAPEVTRAWGGHHCAQDWWWQYARARPTFSLPPGSSCLANCAATLDTAMTKRKEPDYANYIPGRRCKHLWDSSQLHAAVVE